MEQRTIFAVTRRGFLKHGHVLETAIDVVILAAVPGFGPSHFEAAAEKGRHVLVMKPASVDAEAIRSIEYEKRGGVRVETTCLRRPCAMQRVATRNVGTRGIAKIRTDRSVTRLDHSAEDVTITGGW